MSKAKRREALERDLEALEADFKLRLFEALEVCASGFYGLLGRSPEWILKKFPSARALIKDVLSMADEIDAVRERLGYLERNPLTRRLSELRASRGSNVPGEPKLAQLFLDEIRAADSENATTCKK